MAEFLPLSGIQVVTVEQAISAPLATRHLADLGAEIVKIERPDGGDFARAYDSTVLGETSSWFLWVGRGKQSITIDLKSAEGQSIVNKLIESADVFVQNLAPGAVERLGWGADELRKRHPRLITCGISGYGLDGPLRDRKAYDLLLQGEAGVLAVTGQRDDPAKVGVSVADIASGMYAFSAILAALYQRNETGEGAAIDISMLDSIVEWMSAPLYFAHYGGVSQSRAGMRHASIVPYGPYKVADGSVNLAIQNEREWKRFCTDVLLRPELADDPRFAGNAQRLANRVALEKLIEEIFSDLSIIEAELRLDNADIAFARVNDLPGVWDHRQLRARDRYKDAKTSAGLASVYAHPMNVRGFEQNAAPVPALGEHTEEILAGLGYSEADRARLREEKVI